MGAPRLKIASPADLRQIPYEGLTVRDRLAAARHRLDCIDPGALDALAGLLDELHSLFCGRCETEEIRGDRDGRYRRGQLTAHYGLPLLDAVFLARRDGAAAALMASFFAGLAGAASASQTLGGAGRALAAAAGDLAGALMEALESGGAVDSREAIDLRDALGTLKRTVAQLDASLEEIARRGRP